MSLLLRIAFWKFEFLKSPSFAKIHILSILFLATRRDPRKFPSSTAVPVLAFPSSYLKVPFVNTLPGPDLAARTQDGDLITNSVFFFFDHRPLSRGGHFESQGNKKLCFCPSSLALNERLDGQNLLFQHCVIKFYPAACVQAMVFPPPNN